MTRSHHPDDRVPRSGGPDTRHDAVRALYGLITWATLARLSHALPVDFTTPGWQRRSLQGSLAELAPRAGAALGREALVRPDQDQQRPVDVLEDGACSGFEQLDVRRRLVWTKIGRFKTRTRVPSAEAAHGCVAPEPWRLRRSDCRSSSPRTGRRTIYRAALESSPELTECVSLLSNPTRSALWADFPGIRRTAAQREPEFLDRTGRLARGCRCAKSVASLGSAIPGACWGRSRPHTQTRASCRC
jgi:hypothetical protein